MLLFELRSAPLYHWMDDSKVQHLITNDEMLGKWDHYMPVEGKNLQGNSFTRNKIMDISHVNVRLTVNQAKLAARYKIVPVDGTYTHAGRGVHAMTNPVDKKVRLKHLDHMRDRTFLSHDKNFAEEFVVGDIKQIHNYIEEVLIVVKDLRAKNSRISPALVDKLVDYCKQHGIKVVKK